jgi:hypothetical protein
LGRFCNRGTLTNSHRMAARLGGHGLGALDQTRLSARALAPFSPRDAPRCSERAAWRSFRARQRKGLVCSKVVKQRPICISTLMESQSLTPLEIGGVPKLIGVPSVRAGLGRLTRSRSRMAPCRPLPDPVLQLIAFAEKAPTRASAREHRGRAEGAGDRRQQEE